MMSIPWSHLYHKTELSKCSHEKLFQPVKFILSD